MPFYKAITLGAFILEDVEVTPESSWTCRESNPSAVQSLEGSLHSTMPIKPVERKEPTNLTPQHEADASLRVAVMETPFLSLHRVKGFRGAKVYSAARLFVEVEVQTVGYHPQCLP